MFKKMIPVVGLLLVGLLLGWVGRTWAGSEPASSTPSTPAYAVSPQLVVPSAFTYQGTLQDGENPAEGEFDFSFDLYDAEDMGTLIGSDLSHDIEVVNGLFTVQLDFGAEAFKGDARWLAIGVRPGASIGSYTFLAPRQAITAAPYALSLRPGAKIEADTAAVVLSVTNTNTNTTSSTAIYATGAGPTAPVIAANHQGVGHALYGSSASVYPTVGGSNSGGGLGVQGYSDLGNGVQGNTGNVERYGVVGLHPNYTLADLPEGYFEAGGVFGGENGVTGFSKRNFGYAVWGYASGTSSWAGSFWGLANGVQVSSPSGSTGLSVAGGTKNAVVATAEGARLMYTEEATEVWFNDYGFGTTSNGRVIITIDPTYSQVANFNEPYHVFLQPYGDADLFVINRTPTQFEVVVANGDKEVEFSYRIMAKRLGYETDRLERAPWADQDPNLFPGATFEQGKIAPN
jgi:hypothetical protein